MKQISHKGSRRLGYFFLISGTSALWLTFCFFMFVSIRGIDGAPFPFWRKDLQASEFVIDKINLYTTSYYLFNSFLLIIIGILYLLKKYKTHAILAIILAVSVTASMFINPEDSSFVLSRIENIFFVTSFLGIVAYPYGGTLLVPAFLISVYWGVIRGIRFLSGKISYEEETIAIPENTIPGLAENTTQPPETNL